MQWIGADQPKRNPVKVRIICVIRESKLPRVEALGSIFPKVSLLLGMQEEE